MYLPRYLISIWLDYGARICLKLCVGELITLSPDQCERPHTRPLLGLGLL